MLQYRAVLGAIVLFVTSLFLLLDRQSSASCAEVVGITIHNNENGVNSNLTGDTSSNNTGGISQMPTIARSLEWVGNDCSLSNKLAFNRVAPMRKCRADGTAEQPAGNAEYFQAYRDVAAAIGDNVGHVDGEGTAMTDVFLRTECRFLKRHRDGCLVWNNGVFRVTAVPTQDDSHVFMASIAAVRTRLRAGWTRLPASCRAPVLDRDIDAAHLKSDLLLGRVPDSGGGEFLHPVPCGRESLGARLSGTRLSAEDQRTPGIYFTPLEAVAALTAKYAATGTPLRLLLSGDSMMRQQFARLMLFLEGSAVTADAPILEQQQDRTVYVLWDNGIAGRIPPDADAKSYVPSEEWVKRHGPPNTSAVFIAVFEIHHGLPVSELFSRKPTIGNFDLHVTALTYWMDRSQPLPNGTYDQFFTTYGERRRSTPAEMPTETVFMNLPPTREVSGVFQGDPPRWEIEKANFFFNAVEQRNREMRQQLAVHFAADLGKTIHWLDFAGIAKIFDPESPQVARMAYYRCDGVHFMHTMRGRNGQVEIMRTQRCQQAVKARDDVNAFLVQTHLWSLAERFLLENAKINILFAPEQ